MGSVGGVVAAGASPVFSSVVGAAGVSGGILLGSVGGPPPEGAGQGGGRAGTIQTLWLWWGLRCPPLPGSMGRDWGVGKVPSGEPRLLVPPVSLPRLDEGRDESAGRCRGFLWGLHSLLCPSPLLCSLCPIPSSWVATGGVGGLGEWELPL